MNTNPIIATTNRNQSITLNYADTGYEWYEDVVDAYKEQSVIPFDFDIMGVLNNTEGISVIPNKYLCLCNHHIKQTGITDCKYVYNNGNIVCFYSGNIINYKSLVSLHKKLNKKQIYLYTYQY